MKKITSIRMAALTLIAVISFTSCSKNDDTSSVNDDAKVSSFLKTYYSQKTSNGASVEAKVKMATSTTARSEEFGDIVVTEVFVGDDERARGYVITSKETSVFLYFVDVDRIEYKMTTVDIEANQTSIFENIEALDKYVETNEFDFIKVTQDLINQSGQDGTLSRIRTQYGACGGGFRGLYQAHYFLGIRVSSWTAVLDDEGHPVTESC